MVDLSPWKLSPFKLEVQKNTCLALIIQKLCGKNRSFLKRAVVR